MATRSFEIQQLLDQTGVSVRMLRYWIRLKLVPKPIGKGRGARYDDRHLTRVRVVQHLRHSNLTTRAIRSRIGSRSDEELLAMLPAATRAVTADGMPAPPTAPTYPSAMWEVVVLMDGLLLMVNPQKGELLRRVADDIYRHYGMQRSSA